jgi:hypothetical protein
MKTIKVSRIIAILLAIGLASGSASLGQTATSAASPPKDLSADYRTPLPKEGLVPDKETAIKIAEVVLFRLYGEQDTIRQRPYTVKEEDYIWWVTGTLPKDTFGTVFNIGISKHTAAVLHLTR